jgi:hypothetical protein
LSPPSGGEEGVVGGQKIAHVGVPVSVGVVGGVVVGVVGGVVVGVVGGVVVGVVIDGDGVGLGTLP